MFLAGVCLLAWPLSEEFESRKHLYRNWKLVKLWKCYLYWFQDSECEDMWEYVQSAEYIVDAQKVVPDTKFIDIKSVLFVDINYDIFNKY